MRGRLGLYINLGGRNLLVPHKQTLSNQQKIECGFFTKHQTLPLVINCLSADFDVRQWFNENREELVALQHQFGALLFRGFGIVTAEQFNDFVNMSSKVPLGTYSERQLKRDHVKGNVFTSTAHPKEGEIFLHNEQSFNLSFPRNIYFNCHTVAESGGATPLADTRNIYNKVPTLLRDKFLKLGYMYRRNFMSNMYVDWKWAFQTESKEEAERYFKSNDISWQWHDGGFINLSTQQVRAMALSHPETGDKCWFNHCTTFHVETLESTTRQFIQNSFEEHEYPYHTYFGDGSTIDKETITCLKEIYEEETVVFEWQRGDVLMVDNLSVAHGRQPFEGDRLVLTAMSDLCDWENVALGDVIA